MLVIADTFDFIFPCEGQSDRGCGNSQMSQAVASWTVRSCQQSFSMQMAWADSWWLKARDQNVNHTLWRNWSFNTVESSIRWRVGQLAWKQWFSFVSKHLQSSLHFAWLAPRAIKSTQMPQRNQVAVTVHLRYLFQYNLVLQRLESIKSCLPPPLPATVCQLPWEISEQKWRPGILQALPHHSWRALWQRKCIRMNQERHTGSNCGAEAEKWVGINNETAADWSSHSQGLWRNFQPSFRLKHPLR